MSRPVDPELERLVAEAESKMRRDMTEAFGPRDAQAARLGALIERAAYPTKDAVFVRCWGNAR